jgi:hypothetical protein
MLRGRDSGFELLTLDSFAWTGRFFSFYCWLLSGGEVLDALLSQQDYSFTMKN